MKKVMSLFILSFLLLVSSANAANLVSVLVADTEDKDLGFTVVYDIENMREQMRLVAKHTGLELKEVILTGKKMTAKNMLSMIRDVQVNDDDVVLFYYSGHGYRTKSKGLSPWPNLYFSSQDEGVEYETVAEIFESKNPRLFVMLSDICNSFVPTYDEPVLITRSAFTRAARSDLEEIKKNNYSLLFLETDGVIKITSSKIGEYSYGTDAGGMFTMAFMKSLSSTVKSSVDADWRDLLDRAAASVSNDQHPFYVID